MKNALLIIQSIVILGLAYLTFWSRSDAPPIKVAARSATNLPVRQSVEPAGLLSVSEIAKQRMPSETKPDVDEENESTEKRRFHRAFTYENLSKSQGFKEVNEDSARLANAQRYARLLARLNLSEESSTRLLDLLVRKEKARREVNEVMTHKTANEREFARQMAETPIVSDIMKLVGTQNYLGYVSAFSPQSNEIMNALQNRLNFSEPLDVLKAARLENIITRLGSPPVREATNAFVPNQYRSGFVTASLPGVSSQVLVEAKKFLSPTQYHELEKLAAYQGEQIKQAKMAARIFAPEPKH